MHTATKSSKIDISSENKLEEFVKKLVQKTKKGEIFFLYGEMGVGKTTFVKYFINNIQLKLNEKITEVTSPTFNIMNEYILGDLIIKHYDLYRLKSHKELKDLNLFDNNNKEILFIEWPELIQQNPKRITKLYFEYENNYKDRHIKVLIK
ncbi:tRNA (adenosine(37)-N6)-threonylcarbamoyltransferase complex ATPase subunit type 1 TsaE [Candidatus Pelagibacter sp.]|nr:tRNA (adenosine(37)-N6)-threonylcarbamoyltransferase complex ATPase subunit type 1 TsaE [Candidatus Pelagibacter sp.]